MSLQGAAWTRSPWFWQSWPWGGGKEMDTWKCRQRTGEEARGHGWREDIWAHNSFQVWKTHPCRQLGVWGIGWTPGLPYWQEEDSLPWEGPQSSQTVDTGELEAGERAGPLSAYLWQSFPTDSDSAQLRWNLGSLFLRNSLDGFAACDPRKSCRWSGVLWIKTERQTDSVANIAVS